jgi:hypothetical protein
LLLLGLLPPLLPLMPKAAAAAAAVVEDTRESACKKSLQLICSAR